MEGVLGVNWLMRRRQEASMRRGGRQKMGPNRAPATAWIGLRHSSAPPQLQKNTCAKVSGFVKIWNKAGDPAMSLSVLLLFKCVCCTGVEEQKVVLCGEEEGRIPTLHGEEWRAGGGRVGFQYLFLRNFS